MEINLFKCALFIICVLNSTFVMSDVLMPSDKNTNVGVYADISSYLYDDLVIFNDSSGHDTNHPEYYRRNNWHCYSATDSITGACPVTSNGYYGPTYIQLDFVEEKTKLVVPLKLIAFSYSYKCFDQYITAMNTTSFPTCQYSVAMGKDLLVKLGREQHRQLPFGGTWRATLKLRQRNYGGPGEGYNAIWTSNITLYVTDNNNITVYFPEFHSATPTVDLNLQSHPSTARPGQLIDGSKTIDMCLYDGRNANSSWYDVMLTDEMNIGDRNNNQYSIFKNNSTDKTARQRIDYRVTLKHNGNDIEMNNNKVVRLTNIADSEKRVVTLPKMTRPVICTPTPLTVITPQFNQMDKDKGAYSGKLKVIFTPSTSSF